MSTQVKNNRSKGTCNNNFRKVGLPYLATATDGDRGRTSGPPAPTGRISASLQCHPPGFGYGRRVGRRADLSMPLPHPRPAWMTQPAPCTHHRLCW